MLLQEERQRIVEYGKQMSADGLCKGTAGNISILHAEKGILAISPSGMEYGSIKPEDVVLVDLNGAAVDGSRKPSSELALHLAFYKSKPEVRAVVHTHSLYCTTFAVLGRPLEAVHYVIGDAGSAVVPCSPYHTFGTAKLAESAVADCGQGNAVLLGNHGLVCCGSSIESAYALARNLEYVAQLQYQALCIGQPHILTGAQMDEVLEKFKGYGQPSAEKLGY